ncbi:MAG: hypothetical protein GTN62_14055 [Gemmatimonadales bacterium]|nr:hypothetical protein [Gemmatimonadales bacterium]NIN13127.1 hypothetical protein [Gemmatimonadales bacterium]NIN51211.1 hypothetical protein [Gemmatimonadales bacterium]NIP08675.1 hypothetical protein [Gemmatimonadales bacterium]NIR02363.1 hypothetical protein [Gemmatimonadales bacterium]
MARRIGRRAVKFALRQRRAAPGVGGAILALATLACHQGEARLVLRAAWGPEDPITDLHITALPFDPDQILDSLVTLAPSPKPTFTELERELANYRRPDPGRFDEASRPWSALRDTVERLADSLNAMDRTVPSYGPMYDRFRRLYARLAQRAAESDALLRELNGEDVGLARRAQAAAESLRTWEREAFATYPDAAAVALARTERVVHEETTDTTGVAELELEPGRWWIVARYADPENPFQEYYWNVPVTVTRLVPVRLPLTRANTVWRWRH